MKKQVASEKLARLMKRQARCHYCAQAKVAVPICKRAARLSPHVIAKVAKIMQRKSNVTARRRLANIVTMKSNGTDLRFTWREQKAIKKIVAAKPNGGQDRRAANRKKSIIA